MELSVISRLKRFIGYVRKHGEVVIYNAPWYMRWRNRWSMNARGFVSQASQDAIVATEFYEMLCDKQFPRVFFDIGCNHPLRHNNSLYFERYFSFKVYAIDALDAYEYDWTMSREKAVFISAPISSRVEEIVFETAIGLSENSDMYSSIQTYSSKRRDMKFVSKKMKTRTLDDICEQYSVERIGIMSLDIEGHEFEALRGLDLESHGPIVLILENNSPYTLGDENIRDWLSEKGYTFKVRVWGMDDIYVRTSWLC